MLHLLPRGRLHAQARPPRRRPLQLLQCYICVNLCYGPLRNNRLLVLISLLAKSLCQDDQRQPGQGHLEAEHPGSDLVVSPGERSGQAFRCHCKGILLLAG